MRLSEELSRGLSEAKAAEVGEKRERKDGYTYEKQRDGKWLRIGKTADLKAEENRLSSSAALKAKDQPLPTGRVWIDHLPGMPKNTSEAHKDPQTGEYTEERKALHNKIIDAFLNGEGVGGVPAKKVPKGKKPVSLFMMGTTASGKSTARDQVEPNPFDDFGAVVVDPDAIKTMLPEYQASVNASAKDSAVIVHKESSEIANEINKRAMEQRKNVVVDGTGKDKNKMDWKIADARNSGYHVAALMPHVPVDDCKMRADARAEEEGRYVPHNIIEQCAANVGKNFLALQDQFDSFNLFDNRNRPKLDGKWQKPKLIAKAPPKPPKIVDPSLFSVFKRESGIMEWIATRVVNPLIEALGMNGDEKPAAFRGSRVADWYMATAQAEMERMDTMPREFKRGQGIELPLND